jgi:hypothetical protein
MATWNSSLPVAYRLYLPKDWAEDAARREKTEVPEDIQFQTKPEIALEQIRAAAATSGRLRWFSIVSGSWRESAITTPPLSIIVTRELSAASISAARFCRFFGGFETNAGKMTRRDCAICR